MEGLPVEIAGRRIPDFVDRLRRYCGLPWSGGGPEVWAWRYFDAVPAQPMDEVTPADVMCAAAVHPSISRDDLTFFHRSEGHVAEWLREVPSDLRLWQVSDSLLDHLAGLGRMRAPSLPLLTKVLHRKRPHLVPLLDRHLADWYLGPHGRGPLPESWPKLLQAMREAELDDRSRLELSIATNLVGEEVWPTHTADDRPRFSWIRAVDIAVWMGGR